MTNLVLGNAVETDSGDDTWYGRIGYMPLNKRQRLVLAEGTANVTAIGGPDAPGANALARDHALELRRCLSPTQLEIFDGYAADRLAGLLVMAAEPAALRPAPETLPPLESLQNDPLVLELASRNQILLALVGQRAFAFDTENGGRVTRVVANLSGGGVHRRDDEKEDRRSKLTSHNGVLLGAHSEGPYHASRKPRLGHSPSASTLVLSAGWNPAHEPTYVLADRQIIDRLPGLTAVCLTQAWYRFDRSDSYDPNASAPFAVPLIEIGEHGEFILKYNVHTVAAIDSAPAPAKRALEALKQAIAHARATAVRLTPSRVLLINNGQALHARDQVKDNRRMLVRLFGYRTDIEAVVLQEDPLIVRG